MAKVRINGDTSGYIELASPAAAGSNTITLPSSNGSANQLLKNSGTAGTLAWSTLTEDSSGNLNIDSGTLYVDASNNRVGIGTTSPNHLLHAKGISAADITYRLEPLSNLYASTLYVSSASSGDGGLKYESNNNYLRLISYSDLIFNVGSANILGAVGNERARIDSSGRLLVGTSDGSGGVSKLVVQGASNGSAVGVAQISYNGLASAGFAAGTDIGYLRFTDQGSNSGVFAQITAAADATTGANDYPGRLVFSTTADGASSPTERMRISSAGLLTYTGQLVFNGGDTDTLAVNVNGQRVGLYITQQNGSYNNIFRYANSSGKYIDYTLTTGATPTLSITNNNGTGVQLTWGATSWGSVSDIRLKDVTGRFENALNAVSTLEAIKFTWKNDPNKIQQVGLSAQSVQEVLPEAVGLNGNLDSEDDTQYLSVRYTEIIPLLVAALQESKQRIEILEAEVTLLKGA